METVDSWGLEPEKPLEKESLESFNQLDVLRLAAEEEKERLASLTRQENDKINDIDRKVLAIMQQHHMQKYVFPSGRTCTLKQDLSFKIPEGPEERKTFFEFCRESFGDEFIYEKFKMNSQSLQSFANELVNNALEAGDLQFKIPGLTEPKASEYVAFRKGR